jgi:hypothetical protein
MVPRNGKIVKRISHKEPPRNILAIILGMVGNILVNCDASAAMSSDKFSLALHLLAFCVADPRIGELRY